MAQYDITPEEFVTKHLESGDLGVSNERKISCLSLPKDKFTQKVISRQDLIHVLGFEFIQECDKVVKIKAEDS